MLDSFDKKILGVLDSNARSSLTQLARKVRLSKSAVAQRIKKLENEGYVNGYYAVIDSSRLGFLSFRVYLKFYKTSPKKEQEIFSFLLREPRVWWLGLVQGAWNAGFVVWVKDLYDFRNFWLDFMTRFRQNIGKHLISPYLKLRHYAPAYLGSSENRAAGVVGEGPKIDLDDTDKKILEKIAGNARDTVVELAQKTGLTPAVVKYRLKQLVRKGVIVCFRAKINAAKLGYSLYKLEFCLDNLVRLREMQAFAQELPTLLYIDETLGGGDFEAEFLLKSEQELEELLGKFKSKFYDAIREVDYIVYSKVLKYSYFPA